MSELYEVLTPDFEFEDTRGKLVQLSHQGYEQINVLTSRGGAVRGGHYHAHSREAFYVVSGSVVMNFTRGEETAERIFQAGEFFQIHPRVVHSMSFAEDCTLVAMYDKCVEQENGEKDIHSD